MGDFAVRRGVGERKRKANCPLWNLLKAYEYRNLHEFLEMDYYGIIAEGIFVFAKNKNRKTFKLIHDYIVVVHI